VGNLTPLIGVFAFGWDATAVVLLYWSENLIVGFYTIAKMLIVRMERPVYHLSKLVSIPFFLLHFGGFCAGHGMFLIFIFDLAKDGNLPGIQDPWPAHLVFLQLLAAAVVQIWEMRPKGMEWPLACLFISHGVSFVRDYVLGRRYACVRFMRLMFEPYPRIALLHVAILAGALPVKAWGSPIALVCLLIALKTGLDLALRTKGLLPPLPEALREREEERAEGDS